MLHIDSGDDDDDDDDDDDEDDETMRQLSILSSDVHIKIIRIQH